MPIIEGERKALENSSTIAARQLAYGRFYAAIYVAERAEPRNMPPRQFRSQTANSASDNPVSRFFGSTMAAPGPITTFENFEKMVGTWDLLPGLGRVIAIIQPHADHAWAAAVPAPEVGPRKERTSNRGRIMNEVLDPGRPSARRPAREHVLLKPAPARPIFTIAYKNARIGAGITHVQSYEFIRSPSGALKRSASRLYRPFEPCRCGCKKCKRGCAWRRRSPARERSADSDSSGAW